MGADRIAQLWDVGSDAPLGPPIAVDPAVLPSFGPHSEELVLPAPDGIHIIDLTTSGLIDRVCARQGFNLDPVTSDRFFGHEMRIGSVCPGILTPDAPPARTTE
jgi:hypothetical protein